MTDPTVVRCGRLIDGISDEPMSDHVLVVLYTGSGATS